MIELTRLNGQTLIVNCDLIRFAEASPDTVITLVTGEKLLVREPIADIRRLAFAYRVALMRGAWPDAAAGMAVATCRALCGCTKEEG